MPITFRCPNCGKRVKASRKYMGRKGRCEYCGNRTIIPTHGKYRQRLDIEMPADSPAMEEPIVQTQSSIQSVDNIAANAIDRILDMATGVVGQSVLRRNIHNYNGANLAFTHAADMANKLELTQEQRDKITPFPASPNRTTIIAQAQQTPEPPAQAPQPAVPPAPKRNLLPWVLAAGLGGGALTGGGMALNQWFNKPVAPVIENIEEVRPGGVGLQVEP